jgi:hypothetical protein
MLEQCYKVVYKNAENNFCSFFPGNTFMLPYEINKKTIPRTGKVFVFKELSDAMYFMNHYSSALYDIEVNILLCLGYNIKQLDWCLNNFDNISNIFSFWDIYADKVRYTNWKKEIFSPQEKKKLDIIHTPKKTYVADYIIPTVVLEISKNTEGTREFLIPIKEDHPCLVTINFDKKTFDAEGYD